MRGIDLRTAARDYVWLYDRRRSLTVREISRRDGVREATVRAGLARAREVEDSVASGPSPGVFLDRSDRDPRDRLIPLFPMASLTPGSDCPHREPIPFGSRFVCMVCHASGLDVEGRAPAKPRDRAASRPRPDRARCRADIA